MGCLARRKREPSKLLIVDLQCIPGLSHLPISHSRIGGKRVKKGLYFHPSEVPAASTLVTCEELAHPVCIERALPLLDTQCFENLEIPRRPAGIGVEGSHVPAPELLAIIHI
jgi:hypothetical protein